MAQNIKQPEQSVEQNMQSQWARLCLQWNERCPTTVARPGTDSWAERVYVLQVLKLPLATFRSLRARPGPRNLSAPGLETVVGHLSFHSGRTGPRNLCLQWNEKRRVRGPGLALSGTKGAQRQFQDPQPIQPCPQWNQKRRVRGPVALSGTKGAQ